MLKAKEREVECLSKELSEKNDLLKNYCCQVEELKKDVKCKTKKYREILRQLRCANQKEGSKSCDCKNEDDHNDCDNADVEELLRSLVNDAEIQRNSLLCQFQNVKCQLDAMATENNICLKERNEIASQLEWLMAENGRLKEEISRQRKSECEKEELLKSIEKLKTEKKELSEKASCLVENIQELNNNFKETRWALTTEVAEKHDQVQELRRCVAVLEEQLRQADMQTHFKDDIIKELRKELKTSQKTERRGLYDVVAEVRARKLTKNACTSTVKFDVNQDSKMNDCAASCAGEGKITQEEADGENTKIQLECLKKSLKIRMEQLKEQEEFTRDLEDELTRTKMDLATLQEKCEKQDRRSKSLGVSSISEPGLIWHYNTLSCAVNKIEETLRDISSKNSCGLSNCKAVIEKEMERIRSVKNDLKTLEKNKSSCKDFEKSKSCCGTEIKCHSESEIQGDKCNLIHLNDVEVFREKAVTGIVTLEQMKEQICILENLIKKYIAEFPCECDKIQVEACEEKLERLRTEFDQVTEQLCCVLQKLKPEGSYESLNTCETESKSKEDSNFNSQTTVVIDDVYRLKCEYKKLQKDICDQENAAEKIKKMVKQFEDELQCKREQLAEHSRDLSEKTCEIFKIREVIQKVCQSLKDAGCSRKALDQKSPTSSPKITGNLNGFFCDLQELSFLLEKWKNSFSDGSKKLKEENEKLKEELSCLKKCICNKEETLRVLQDTVKLRECQIEELKSRMETSESESCKLAQDVEEKCRLIANLQEAVRKCKRFEINEKLAQVESLQFELCDLDYRLKKCEKEILLRDHKIEGLHDEITNLSSKNCLLVDKIKLIEPKFRTMYKTCHLFEKMVNDLQEELNGRECDVESLCRKIKELECELESEFKKCEDRAAEDSKCIEELSRTLQNFQSELSCARQDYDVSIADAEHRLTKEREMNSLRERELNNTICQLQNEIDKLQNQLQDNSLADDSSNKISDLECLVREAECRQRSYERKMEELKKTLDCTIMEHEEERKGILQKLCEEKKENLKNKTLITKLNENIKRKIMAERTLKEYVERSTEDINNLKAENHELRTEVEARKKIMCAMEREDVTNLSELEELICQLKNQKVDLKSRCCSLKGELDKEAKLKRLLECRVEDLNSMLQNKLQEFDQLVDNYKCCNSKIQQTLLRMKEVEENLMCFENKMRQTLDNSNNLNDYECLKNLLDMKTAENAKLISQVQILKVEMESIQTENAVIQANKDSIISSLRHEANCLETELQDLEAKYQELTEENKSFQAELEQYSDKEACLQNEFRERQKELCGKLRATICEKNDLLNSLDELQKQLEQICLENVNKEKMNRELSEECSRLKVNNNANDNYLKNKSEKIICNLNKEVKTLHCELSNLKENYDALNREYQNLVEQYKCCEKKKCNLEKLYMEANTENKNLQELKVKYERELCELRTQNVLLKDMMANKGENVKIAEDRKKFCDKIRDLTLKIKTLEKRVIPDLEQEIAEKNCCIENLKIELKEANISSQRMRNEALRVILHTRKYLAAQRCANDTLKSRLECSNKRGNMLGAENRELEDQLKAVTRMNEFLLCQLESNKNDTGEVEPRSYSPLPWGCPTVERDTSSSEYMAESGIQSMQPSPTNMDYGYDNKHDSKRNSPQWNSLKKNKCGGSVEYPVYRNGVR